ncbi:MAG: nuclease-related domain-containing protein [Terrimesophilobacter sp.]
MHIEATGGTPADHCGARKPTANGKAQRSVLPALSVSDQNFPLVRMFLGHYGTGRSRSIVSRFFGRSPLSSESRRMYRAAAGELGIDDALKQLGPDWSVCSSVPIARDGGNVDHLAIGPAGVFAISVRNHVGDALWVGEGVVLVEGEPVPHIRDAESSAVRCAQLLSDAVGDRVDVIPCLVVVGPRSVTVTRPPRRVAILTPRELKPWLKYLPATLSTAQIFQLSNAAQVSTTWHSRSEGFGNPALALSVFRQLQSDVNQSRRIRLAWMTGVLLMVWMITMAGVGGIASGLLLR